MTNLNEQIWKEEVDRFAEDTMALWRTQYDFFLRAQSQGAPQPLLQELVEISDHFRTIHGKLAAISPCFPKETA